MTFVNQEKLIESLRESGAEIDVSTYNNDHTLIAIMPFGEDADDRLTPFLEFDADGNLCAAGAYKN